MTADRGLFISLTAVLAGFGALMVYSASITSWPTNFERVYFSRHLIFLTIGAAAACIAGHVPARIWKSCAPALLGATIVLLVLVLIPGVGTKVNGAQRWLRFGPVSAQPSELAKIALPLMLARILSLRSPEQLRGPVSGTVPVLWPILVTVPLVLIEPDLGTAAFLIVGCAIALFVGAWPMRNFVVSAGFAVPLAMTAVSLRPYQVQRITGFFAGWDDFQQAPYQLKQSMYALGSGGLLGTGIGKGWQKLSFLPEANTDFVFAVVGEELGLMGTIAVAALWAGIFYVGLRMLQPLPERSFRHIAAFTLLAQLVFQAALNTAVVIGLVPPKGIPHPFLSSGGSNLVMSLLTVGIILSLTRDTEAEGLRPVGTETTERSPVGRG